MDWCLTSFANTTMSPQLIAQLSLAKTNVSVYQLFLVLAFALTYVSRNSSKNVGNQLGTAPTLNALFLSFIHFCIIRFTCNLFRMIEMFFPCSTRFDKTRFNVRIFVEFMLFLSEYSEELVCLAGVLLVIDCIAKIYFYKTSEGYQISQKLAYLWKFAFVSSFVFSLAIVTSVSFNPSQRPGLSFQVLLLTLFVYKLFTVFQLILCVAFCIICYRCSNQSKDALSFGLSTEVFQIALFQSFTLAAFVSMPGLIFLAIPDFHLLGAVIFKEMYSYVWPFFTTHVLLTSVWTVYKLRCSAKSASPNIIPVQA
ncbi:hypothetical protein L596_008747 [Steinernema carpocapsae]|uniref:Uncharacterized protein n=1 Tax=Steinernema carpocapsae TaxID=34508 RepID=A0A4U5PE79_STECR|nr:hypothetical protein L596_008747 [Steinernema carpocapsae]